MTGNAVVFNSDTLISTLTYPLKTDNSRQNKVIGTNNVTDSENKVIATIKENPKISQPQIAKLTGIPEQTVNHIIASLRDSGKIVRIGKTKGGHWEIR